MKPTGLFQADAGFANPEVPIRRSMRFSWTTEFDEALAEVGLLPAEERNREARSAKRPRPVRKYAGSNLEAMHGSWRRRA